jgi:hypothetical protein
MKTTIAKLLNSDKALNNLLEQKLPLGISIQLGKVVQELEPVFKKADEVRLEILKKHGEEILKDGQPIGEYQFTPESRKLFESDIVAAFNDEIELNIVEVDPERLPEACLTGKDAIALSWLWKKET